MKAKEVGRPRKKTSPLHVRVNDELLREVELIVHDSNVFNSPQDLCRYLLAEYVEKHKSD